MNLTTTLGWPSSHQKIRCQSLIPLLIAGWLVFAGRLFPLNAQESQHQLQQAVGQFDLHPELNVQLFAGEPMLANPSNIDVDHRGRVWVCEVLNYRRFRNKDAKLREAGDRILILEDTDGDAKCDQQKVFYQGRDIDSAHGVCVLGNRVIVSANDSVFVLTDTDGDDRADRKEVLFTGIGGTQHDHGIHSFLFGPDGKLYFNFGNEGKQICDKEGKPIVDASGRKVVDDGKPYRQGMIFRCNLDGSEFETLAWNFRNNWELCVDSYGGIWQSDNDDDGNRATRINYVIPFGDYGYKDASDGSHWNASRTGMHKNIPLRHWHQNDPGVIPNLLQTGAGSPTGICFYEGTALPEAFRNQVIHCDAGPNIVRCYQVDKQGAGYSAKVVDVIDGARKNQWFRPSDVAIAPDGTLIVADWYDPGVGGHRMQDTERGRLFRVTAKQAAPQYKVPPFDVSSPEAATRMLKSPNLATRFLAWDALQSFGEASIEPLRALWQEDNPMLQARALWALGKLPISIERRVDWIREGLDHDNPDLRVTALRLAVQLRNELDITRLAAHINPSDPAPEFRRTLLVAMRQLPELWESGHLAQLWALVAKTYQPGDRWMLESLGIAADGHWDQCMEALSQIDDLSPAAKRDILWRSRGSQSAQQLAREILNPANPAESCLRYFRAFDFLDPSATASTLAELAFGKHEVAADKQRLIITESVSRIDLKQLSEEQSQRLSLLVKNTRGTPQFVELVGKLKLKDQAEELLQVVLHTDNRQLAADAMRLLMEQKQLEMVRQAVVNATIEQREALCNALVNCGQRQARSVLSGIGKREQLPPEIRTYAIRRLGEIRSGVSDMMRWLQQGEDIDKTIEPAIAAALHGSGNPDARRIAAERYPLPKAKNNQPLPALARLLSIRGDAAKGESIFENAGTCAKCHVVAGKGIEVGPDLSQIGDKLTRSAMFESILFPSAGISHNYENWLVMTFDGQLLVGILVSETEGEIRLRDEKGITHKIAVDDVEQKQRQSVSLMPADLHSQMSQQELVDLVEYLVQLKK